MRQRRMVMAGFDPGHVRAYYPALVKVAQRLVTRWAQAAHRQETIVLQSDLMRYTVDTIAGLAFGAEVDTLGADGDVIQQHLDKVFPALFRRITAPIPLWRIFPSRADRALVRSMVEVNKAVDNFIAQARLQMQAEPQRYTQPQNLLEAMLAAADRPDSGLSDAQVAGNVMTMLLAGEDTTANTIAWMIYLLWTHPEALAKACDEVRSKVRDCQQPSMDEVADLEFIEACIHETMRLKPVGPQLPLQANADVLVGDVSFISLTMVLPGVVPFLKPGGKLLMLVKPQFELQPENIGKNGLVKDPAMYPVIEKRIRTSLSELGLEVTGWYDSAIDGGDGNREFFVQATKPA
jgi:cytochrome P450